VLTNI